MSKCKHCFVVNVGSILIVGIVICFRFNMIGGVLTLFVKIGWYLFTFSILDGNFIIDILGALMVGLFLWETLMRAKVSTILLICLHIDCYDALWFTRNVSPSLSQSTDSTTGSWSFKFTNARFGFWTSLGTSIVVCVSISHLRLL